MLLSWEREQSVRYFQHMQVELEQCAAAKVAVVGMGGAAAFACASTYAGVLQQRVEASLLMRAAAKFGELEAECKQRFANMRTHQTV